MGYNINDSRVYTDTINLVNKRLLILFFGDIEMTNKAGRNDPCPCGSGKKYKKCCWEKDQSRRSSGLKGRATVGGSVASLASNISSLGSLASLKGRVKAVVKEEKKKEPEFLVDYTKVDYRQEESVEPEGIQRASQNTSETKSDENA